MLCATCPLRQISQQLQFSPPFGSAVTLESAICELLKSKQASKKSPQYVTSLRVYLAAFSRAHPNYQLSNVDLSRLVIWFARRMESPQTMRSNIGRLSALFAFAIQRGWIDSNPTKQIDLPSVSYSPPLILSPEQCISAYRACREDCRAWLVLCLWCGLRPSEAAHITPKDVDLVRGVITVRISKVRHWRIVPILENVRGVLATDFIVPSASTRRRAVRAIRDALKLPAWPQDVLRHTAASYWLAQHQDAGKVATWLGNSPKILLTHYNGLASQDAAESFFSIQP